MIRYCKKIIQVFKLLLTAIFIIILLFVSIQSYRLFAFTVYLNSSMCLRFTEDGYYISEYDGSSPVPLFPDDKIGYNSDYVFGTRSTKTTIVKKGNFRIKKTLEFEYFVIDTKAMKLYSDSDKVKLCSECNLSPEIFDSIYDLSFFYHYERLIGELVR